MPSPKTALLLDLDYTAWANRTVLEACSTLSVEELERDLRGSHGSILAVLRHIYYAERVWLKRLRKGDMGPLVEMGNQRLFGDAAPEPGLDELRLRWPEVGAGFRLWIEELPDADLDRELRSRRPDGTDFLLPVWKIVRHAVNHSTLHRGQVISMLRALGKQPPGVDLVGFFLEEPGD